jgi:CO/xanthine dehydrogenase FAD-binding subunit
VASEYLRPTTLAAAVAALAAQPSRRIVAGATDVFPAQVARVATGGSNALGPVLDVTAIPGLRGITDHGADWSIGATTTWADIAGASLPTMFDGLRAAARDIGGVQIQARGTIAGNLVTASPAGDSIPCLLVLDAQVVLASTRGERVLPLAAFLTGYRSTALRPGELITAIRVPKRAGRGGFRKLGARRYLVISIAMVAGLIEIDARSRRVRHAAIAVGACGPVACRLTGLEARLCGAPIGEVRPTPADLTMLAPIEDVRASAEYRRAAALQLIGDLLDECAAETGAGRA